MAMLNDLDETKPLGSDPKSGGDDSLRQIKAKLKEWAGVLFNLGTGAFNAGAIPTAALADGAVTTAKIAAGAVTTAKIGDGEVTAAKLAAGSQKFIQSVTATVATKDDTTTVIPDDDTIPQNTEGKEALTQAITPTSATSKIRVTAVLQLGASAAGITMTAALFKDSGADALQAVGHEVGQGSRHTVLTLVHEEVAASTSARTYKVRFGPASGTGYLNATAGNTRLYGGVCASYLRVEEIAP